MRLKIHYRIAKKISAEIREAGLYLHEKSFLLGNLFPDLIQSFFWCRHEYSVSQNHLRKRIENLKKKTLFFSFKMGILTHYICDYFCYPHSRIYDKNILEHIIYEVRQKIPENFSRLNLNIKSFTIEELGLFVGWYEKFRPLFKDSEFDLKMATHVSSGFLQAAYQ